MRRHASHSIPRCILAAAILALPGRGSASPSSQAVADSPAVRAPDSAAPALAAAFVSRGGMMAGRGMGGPMAGRGHMARHRAAMMAHMAGPHGCPAMRGMGMAGMPMHAAGAQAQPVGPAPVCTAATPGLAAEGHKVFTGKGNCYTCHGADARGTPLAPNLVQHKWLNIDGSYAAIAELVQKGVAQPKEHPAPMPPMGGAALTPGEVCAVAAYVYRLSHKE